MGVSNKDYLVSLLFLVITVNSQQTFSEFRTAMENRVKGLAEQMQTQFSQGCSNGNITSCNVKSENYCLGTAQRSCLTDFALPENCNGVASRLALKSAIRFPDSVNVDNLNNNQKFFACSSALLETKFQSLYQQNQNQYTFTYFGSVTGGFRNYPSFRQEQDNGACIPYDPRLRPWFAAGISSSKNIIMLLPIDGLTGTLGNLAIIKSAANVILATLTYNDFFNIILYNTQGNLLNPNITFLQRATETNVNNAKALIEQLQNPIGQTNFQSAFNAAFDVLTNTSSQGLGAPCIFAQNIFLMFANTQPSQGQTTFAGLQSAIDNRNANWDITMFTYTLPTTAVQNLRPIMQNLACTYNGISFQFSRNQTTDSDIISKISEYYLFLAYGIEVANPSWTSPYTDAFGYGRLVTVVYPAYINESGINRIIGVAGIDVRLSYIMNTFRLNSEEDIANSFLSTTVCANTSIFDQNPCRLQLLRPEISKCERLGTYANYTNCPNISLSTCNVTSSTVFAEAVDKSAGICCQRSNNGALIGGLVGGIGGFILLLLIAFIVYKLWKKKNSSDEPTRIKRAESYNDVVNPNNNSKPVIKFPEDGQRINQQQRNNFLKLKQKQMNQKKGWL